MLTEDDTSEAATDLVQKLLVLAPTERLGGYPIPDPRAAARGAEAAADGEGSAPGAAVPGGGAVVGAPIGADDDGAVPMLAGSSAILAHPFFASLDVDAEPPLWQRPSPFTPTLRHEADTSNFDVNELQRVSADRMRTQLEMEEGEIEGEEVSAGGGKGNEAEEEGEEGEEEGVGNSSFKTVNATNLARMQLGTDAPMRQVDSQ